MVLDRFVRLVDLLTLERATAYALVTMAIGCFVIFSEFYKAPQEISGSTDFPAFYNAGRILNEYPRGSLYDQKLQHQLYLEVAPQAADDRFFAYTPFFALFFSPLALLPFSAAFVFWIVISLAFFTAGFWLAWSTTDLPIEYRARSFLIALSFLPFFAWCVLEGQSSAFGFFFLALAIYLDRKSPFASGYALAMLLYKPPLLILLVPMLIVTKRWRSLSGFAVGAFVLALISFALIGLSGLPAYLAMLKHFSLITAQTPNWREIDGLSFFLPFFRRPIACGLLLAMAAIALPFIFKAWSRNPETAWSHAITWTMVLNFYVLLYDSTLVILAVLISVSALRKTLPIAYRWLLLVLFLAPWLQTDFAKSYGFRPMTIALIAFGCYQLWALNSSYKPASVLSSRRR